jgi:hypothetical protein
MRSLLSSIIATALLVGTTGETLAQSQPCMRTAEKTAFELAGLKSELMVIAVDCQVQDRYNAFVMRFRPDLQAGEKGLNTYFSRTSHGAIARAHDDYITALANSQSQDALTRGTYFCDEHKSMFDQVLALKDSQDLRSYAATKGLVQPIDVVDCPMAEPPAPNNNNIKKKKKKTVTAKADTIKATPVSATPGTQAAVTQ